MRETASNDDAPSDDERRSYVVAQLLKYDEAKGHLRGELSDTDDSISAKLEEEIACIDLLHRVWSNGAPAIDPVGMAFADFTLLQEIGRGGMGVVHEAQQLSLRRRVAIKILPIASALSEERLARFRNEALAAATLNHPNIVPVYSVGCEQGLHYYAMQLIRGFSLAELISYRRNSDSSILSPAPQRGETTIDQMELCKLPVPSESYFDYVANLGAQAAEALEYSHKKGIVHRDVKPANLLLDETGKLWITDFGLARLNDEAGLTSTGDMLGTLRYMSPERISSNYPIVDPSSDVYSLGMTLYELIALRPAFAGQDRAILLRQILEGEPPRLRHVAPQTPVDLETIVAKAIEKDPAQRYGSAHELAADLRRFINREPIAAKPPSVVDRALKWSQRHQTIVRIVGAFLAVLIATWAFNSLRVSRALDETSDLLYVADMGLALQAWEDGWSDEVRSILERHRPQGSQTDRRGFEWRLLYETSQKPRAAILKGHHGRVTELAPFSDRRRLASVGEDGTLRIWDLRTHSLLRTIQVSSSPLYAVAISPDSRYVAVGSIAVHVIDLESNEPIKEIFRHDSNVEALDFSHDGKQIAAGIRYHEVVLLSLDGQIVKRIPCDSRSHNLEFHPHRDELIITNRTPVPNGDNAGVVQIWSGDLAELRLEVNDSPLDLTSRLTHARSSPCGRFIVAGETYQAKLHLIPLSTGKISDSTLTSRGRLADLAYAPDGESVAAAYENGVIELYAVDVDTDGLIAFSNRPRVFKASEGELNSVQFINSHTLVTCGEDGCIRLWSLRGQHSPPFDVASDDLRQVEISPDGKHLLVVEGNKITLFDVPGGDVRYQCKQATFHQCVAWSPQSDRYAIARRDALSVSVLGLDGTVEAKFQQPDETVDLCFSPNGSQLATITDRLLQLWDLKTKRNIQEWKLPLKSTCVMFSRDGSKLLVGGHLVGVTLIPLDANTPIQQLPCDVVESMATNSAGSMLATGHLDGVIRLWDLDANAPPRELVSHRRYAGELAFTPDDQTLISASGDGSIRLWSVPYARGFGCFIKRTHNGSKESPSYFSLSADGRLLVTKHRASSPGAWAFTLWRVE